MLIDYQTVHTSSINSLKPFHSVDVTLSTLQRSSREQKSPITFTMHARQLRTFLPNSRKFFHSNATEQLLLVSSKKHEHSKKLRKVSNTGW